ncbi:hypothetical protein GIB67_042924 [Kingdonia uniflora]|uniref:CASP-like protein n=1 Tax=Kingdonia uniflora TaxID=39325 RepID=A0A7J7P2S3_9MAGN|nr:hypothetical protein GIB67_042924 [Kingdonia uniflora]
MESDKPVQESGTVAPEPQVLGNTSGVNPSFADLSLRILLFVSTLAAVIVMVTSKQVKLILISQFVPPVTMSAKFDSSPAFTYFVVALSVTCLYSLSSVAASLFLIRKPCCLKKLMFPFILIDSLMVGIVASATGATAGVAYIGLKGNSHVGWMKVCYIYDKFCHHVGASVAMSLFSSVLLVSLIALSAYTLHRRSF